MHPNLFILSPDQDYLGLYSSFVFTDSVAVDFLIAGVKLTELNPMLSLVNRDHIFM